MAADDGEAETKLKLTTEEALRAYTIGELKPLTHPIVVSDYDPAWPEQFEREAPEVATGAA